MRPENIIYVALRKSNGAIMSGAKGQYSFKDKGALRSSVGQSYSYEAEKAGVKPKDLYNIYEVNLDTMTKELVN